MCLKHVEKKKLLVHHNKVAKWVSNYFYTDIQKITELLYQKNTEAATDIAL